jgi:hypothetical protein
MSKKLLKESTIRRFGGLAGIKPASTSNFLKEFDNPVYMREEEEEGEELEVVDDVELELPPEEEEIEDVELDFEEPVEAGGDAEGLVISLLDKVKEWAIDQGVEMDVQGDEEIEDVALDIEEPLEDPLEEPVEDVDIEFEEEATLEEMINSILSEDDEEDITEGEEEELEEKKDWGGKKDDCEGKSTPECREKDKDYNWRKKDESIQVVDDEKVIQEVTKRVKQRLARIAKARKRQ